MNDTRDTLLNDYLKERALKGRKTDKRKSNLMVFVRYAEERGRDILRFTYRDAQEFQTHCATRTREGGGLRYGAGSVLAIMGSVTAWYEYLRRRKLVFANPFAAVDRVRKERTLPKNILTEEKMDSFLRHLKEFWKGKDLNERRGRYKAHVIGELMYSTGMRVSEVASVRAEDVDFLRGTVRVTDTKTNTRRDAILNEYAVKVLRLYVEMMRSYVLFGKNGADGTRLFGARYNLQVWLNSILKDAGRELGFPKITSHHFRHAVGYHLLRGGCDIRYIQEILGHKALTSTQIYTKVDKEDLRGVIDEYHPRRFSKAGRAPGEADT